MKLFFIKKAFFDGWDNLIGLVVHNLVFIALIMLGMFSFQYLVVNEAMMVLFILLFSLLISLHSAGTAQSCFIYARYTRGGFAEYKNGLKQFYRHGLFLGFMNFLLVCCIMFVLPFYASFGNIFGLVISVIIFWVTVIVLMAMQYFLPLMATFTADKPLKTFKKCFMILMDNMGFSIFFLFYNIITAIISTLLAMLAPGSTGIIMAQCDALKILMYKYDYLEEHPEANRKKIPWDELLYEEKENVGHRTLRGMIFPWKD